MIKLINVNKSYKVIKRKAGFKNAVKSFFSREHEVIQALQNVSFSVQDGEMVGYIGPNGAGKSTTIKIMCGILTPDSGICEINGKIPYKERREYVRDIGVVFGQRSQLWWDVPVIDSFDLLREIYKIDDVAYKKNVNELSEILDIREILKVPARNLSLGQRMRCEMAGSLLHDPKILFLDEPTIGLDAVSKIGIRKFINQLNVDRGTTVILTTHDMQDVEAITQRILLIGKGSLLFDGSYMELKKRFSDKKTLFVEFQGEAPSLHESMTFCEQKEGQIKVMLDPEIMSVSEAITFLASRTDLVDISVSDISAEEMVAKLYKEYHI